MPDSGYYEKIPRPESIAHFEKVISDHKMVMMLDKVEEQVYFVLRRGKPAIKVFLTNIYIVSTTDVFEITSSHDGITCIVTMSMWNSYSSDAKEYAKEKGIRGVSTLKKNQLGLFRFGEFMGALYYEGNKFLDYIPPERRRN